MLTQYNLKMPHAVYGGENAMDNITAIIKARGAKKVAMFTDKGIEGAGLFALPEEAVKASGKVFTISYPHRTFPTLRAVKALMDSGKLGRVTYARVRNVHNGSSANWLPPHFYDKAQCGGGAMIDLGSHPMYTLYWLLGLSLIHI